MTVRGWRATTVVALTSLLCGACVAPAPTSDLYAGKAEQTALAAMSSARTAVLAVDTRQRDSLTSAALEVLLQESEASLASISATFDTVQPPDTSAADTVARELDELLTAAAEDARWLRISARRGDPVALRVRADRLSVTADRLDDFAAELAS